MCDDARMSETTSTEAAAPEKRPLRSPEEITTELETARQSLVSHVDAIQEYVKPANIAGRVGQRFKRIYITEDGSPKVKTIAITVAVVGVYVLYRIRK
jgi:Protein of unknown function (DUF3618)